MPCEASYHYYPVEGLEIVSGSEHLDTMAVSNNRLSLTKFRCPNDSCNKTVDVYFGKDGMVKPRHHNLPGEKSAGTGRGRGGTPKSASEITPKSVSEIVEEADERHSVEMRRAVKQAEATLADIGMKIAGAEETLRRLQSDKLVAERLLADERFAAYRTPATAETEIAESK